ncbi:MAG: FtsH protease activity modulator HflK [Desulfohalobiaceae bacterium]|nr:FtsH protease activity modulator HflK [Desulfohalobiaceae bacterium]
MNWDWDRLQQQRRNRQGGGDGGGRPSPDWEELKRKLSQLTRLRISGVGILIGLIVLLWLASGIYIVDPDEVGVVKRFGAYTRTVQSGPHYHLPYPVETVQTPSVTTVRRIEIGFRTPEGTSKLIKAKFRKVPKEALMLTGDENLVNVQYTVQYTIKNAEKYLFQISQPRTAVKEAAEASMRDVVGDNEISDILTTQKFEIQNESQELLQDILDSYNSGIQVSSVKMQDVHPPDQVRDAFKDVASAREDKSTLINQAQAYRNKIIPEARGQVASIRNEAEAYKETKVRQARGEAARFDKLLKQYRKAKRITRKRLYLEAMQDVLGDVQQKTILTDSASENMVPFLPLNQPSGTKRGLPGEAGQKQSSGDN